MGIMEKYVNLSKIKNVKIKKFFTLENYSYLKKEYFCI
jgi:hypothetical protein